MSRSFRRPVIPPGQGEANRGQRPSSSCASWTRKGWNTKGVASPAAEGAEVRVVPCRPTDGGTPPRDDCPLRTACSRVRPCRRHHGGGRRGHQRRDPPRVRASAGESLSVGGCRSLRRRPHHLRRGTTLEGLRSRAGRQGAHRPQRRRPHAARHARSTPTGPCGCKPSSKGEASQAARGVRRCRLACSPVCPHREHLTPMSIWKILHAVG